MNKITVLLAALFLAASASAREEGNRKIITVEPEFDGASIAQPKSVPDIKKTLASLKETGGLYVMTFYGSYDRQLEKFHAEILKSTVVGSIVKKRQYCSLFSHYGDPDSPLFGRNFDNKYSDLLLCYCFPENGYASIAFTPMMEFGFSERTKLNMESSIHKMKLLNSPCLTIEGMNEKGLCLALASIDPVKYAPEKGKPSRWLIHLIREILDQAADVDEAVRIAGQYNVFDNGLNLLTHHILVADPVGGSVVLEHDGTRMRMIPMNGTWQALTNTRLFEVSTEKRRAQCVRYRNACDVLKRVEGGWSWTGGMDLLQKVAQHDQEYFIRGERMVVNTQWSAVFNMKKLEVYICLKNDYDKVYRIILRDRAAYADKAN